jgi:hypothetical protein
MARTASATQVAETSGVSHLRERLSAVVRRCGEIDRELAAHFQATSPYAVHDGPTTMSVGERHRLAAVAPGLRSERLRLQGEYEDLMGQIHAFEVAERERKLAAARARLRPEARQIDRLLAEVRDRALALARRAGEEGLPESATFDWDLYLEAPTRAWRREWGLD